MFVNFEDNIMEIQGGGGAGTPPPIGTWYFEQKKVARNRV